MPIGSWAKNIFGGKLRNPYFCHILGMRGQKKKKKRGMHCRGQGFKIGLNEKLGRLKET